jgi:hypothetical protein
MPVSEIDWVALGTLSEQHQLFVLAWRQLLDDATPDTWQVRSTNVLSLLRELEAIAVVALMEHEKSAVALAPLLKELKACVARDHVVSSRFPWFESAQGDLTRRVEALGAEKRPGLEEIARQARVAHKRMSRSYRPALEELLVQALDAPKEKQRLLDLTLSWATFLVLEGFSLTYLRSAGRQCLENPLMPFNARVVELIKVCSMQPAPHRVHFVVKEWEREVGLERKDTWVKQPAAARAALPVDPQAEQFLKGAHPADRVVALSVSARDPHAARRAAEAQLARDFAALSFNTHRDPTIHGAALVTSDVGSVLVAADGSRRNAVPRPVHWVSQTHSLLSLGGVLREDDHRQLSAVLQYYRLAITHPSDEVRLVNLWVATETLVRGLSAPSIIGRVTDYLPPLLAVRNVRVVTKNLARMLTNSVSYKHLRRVGVMPRTENHVDPKSLLETLKDQARADDLLGRGSTCSTRSHTC